jgi:CheY-like chemotaxis protein/HPt (histidine-containing phosphotransfer) domain-containing protein
MLDELGYSSEVVSNGDEALQALQLTQFDLVLMDCHMPIRNGYDTTREIRRLEKESSSDTRIPIAALTADLMQNNRQRCLECGMDDYVSKPFTGEQLRIVLNRWLAGPDTEGLENEVVIDADGFSELTETVTLASIDVLALEQIIQLDSSPGKNLVREIVVSYCADSTKLMLQLRSAIADGDTAEIEVLAHSLKGSSGQIGATLLAALCEQLISGARNNDLSDAPTLCERAAVEHSAVITALDRELQRMAA